MTQRQQKILEILGEDEVPVQTLAERFDVTPVTIRRDLDALQAAGLVERTHGGALLARRGRVEFTFRQRTETMAAVKRAIGQAAAERIRPGMTISIDTGTTTLEVARALTGHSDLRVLTSSLPVASLLHPLPGIDLVLLGGQVRKDSPDLCGELTESNLRRFHVDLAVLGTDAADEQGLMTTSPSVARVSHAMITHANQRLLVVDHTKFERHAFVRFADWDFITTVVTDVPPGWLGKRSRVVIPEDL